MKRPKPQNWAHLRFDNTSVNIVGILLLTSEFLATLFILNPTPHMKGTIMDGRSRYRVIHTDAQLIDLCVYQRDQRDQMELINPGTISSNYVCENVMM